MPTILYEQGFRFRFYAADGGERRHVHVEGSGGQGKWWIDAISEAWSQGFTRSEHAKIEGVLRARQGHLLERWHEFFPPNP